MKQENPYKNQCTYDPLGKVMAAGLIAWMIAGTAILYNAGEIGHRMPERSIEQGYEISMNYQNINK